MTEISTNSILCFPILRNNSESFLECSSVMENTQETQLLEQYASIVNSKILSSQSDLNPKDRAMSEMLAWCRKHDSIVVLDNGNILCSHPTTRVVQNCKIIMRNKGLTPGLVYPARKQLINMLLANALDSDEIKTQIGVVEVSTQQQRLRTLVKEALAVEATDIHIEIRKDIAKIRFRKHGELLLHSEWLPRLAKEIAAVAFNKETDNAVSHFNPLIPQNASMPLQIDDREVRLRLASLPAQGGFDVVLRILTIADETILSLEKLGYSSSQIAMIKKAIAMPHGAIIMAGPTGSGKTTTLASCMNLVNEERKIFTIEDPVEKIISNATQVPVNTEHYDRSFASMARTVLRMDPDVIILGEMRDEDTANVMMRAAITGHLVFSTIHTNSAPGIVTRLVDLGISSSLLATPNLLVCLICQRLVPILCEHCAVSVQESSRHQDYLYRWRSAFGPQLTSIKARGINCSECGGLGISGRRVIAEIIWVDEMGRQFIQEQNILGWTNYLKDCGWQTYHDHLLHLVKTGECDPLDAEKIMGEINILNDAQFTYKDVIFN